MNTRRCYFSEGDNLRYVGFICKTDWHSLSSLLRQPVQALGCSSLLGLESTLGSIAECPSRKE
jgi:hypothetical protein